MQVALLGTLTRTEERRLTDAIAAAAECSTNCPAAERSLMAAAGKNPYQQALFLIRMAPFQSDQHVQVGPGTDRNRMHNVHWHIMCKNDANVRRLGCSHKQLMQFAAVRRWRGT